MPKIQEIGQYIDLGYFVWPRANSGYYIDHNARPDLLSGLEKKTSGPFVLEKPETTGYITTKPLDESPTLFLEFAGIDGSEESIIDFANKHGILTEGILLENIPHNSKDINGITITTRVVRGDSLDTWQREHFVLSKTVQIWEWLKEGNIEKLQLVICWYDGNKAIRYFIGNEDDLKAFKKDGGIVCDDGTLRRQDNNAPLRLMQGELASQDFTPGLFSRFVPGDVILPAQTVIQKIINEKLQEHPVHPMLLMDKNNNLKQYFIPQNLLSAMWFQFFQTASGKKKFKRCEVCKDWEDVTEKKSTWSKHPECATRERTRKYRERLKQKRKKEG